MFHTKMKIMQIFMEVDDGMEHEAGKKAAQWFCHC